MTRAEGPLGSRCEPDGTHFRVFSSVADEVRLCLPGRDGAETCVRLEGVRIVVLAAAWGETA